MIKEFRGTDGRSCLRKSEDTKVAEGGPVVSQQQISHQSHTGLFLP